ncbi:TIGR04540 family protein [Bacillus sp. NTK071]|uniref:TIGR04540 family protein n=1 Tax=Bacillus sp. NTK071 TaxID=2802175 RepID=UPI0032E50968
MKRFCKTQRELAVSINTVVDAYWDEDITEKKLLEEINKLHTQNKNKMIKGRDFTTVLKQHCGKRRLEVVDNILKIYQF